MEGALDVSAAAEVVQGVVVAGDEAFGVEEHLGQERSAPDIVGTSFEHADAEEGVEGAAACHLLVDPIGGLGDGGCRGKEFGHEAGVVARSVGGADARGEVVELGRREGRQGLPGLARAVGTEGDGYGMVAAVRL